MKTYLEQHPNATLREYVDYFAAEQQKIENTRKIELENRKAYLKSCTGKYFKVVFNSNSSIYFKVTNDLTKEPFRETIYRVYSDNTMKRLTVNNLGCISNDWLLGEYCDKISEISEEDYNAIVEFGNSLINTIDQLNKL